MRKAAQVAQGLMQLMPATAERFGVSDSFAPSENIAGGVKYLDWLMSEFGRDPDSGAGGLQRGRRRGAQSCRRAALCGDSRLRAKGARRVRRRARSLRHAARADQRRLRLCHHAAIRRRPYLPLARNISGGEIRPGNHLGDGFQDRTGGALIAGRGQSPQNSAANENRRPNQGACKIQNPGQAQSTRVASVAARSSSSLTPSASSTSFRPPSTTSRTPRLVMMRSTTPLPVSGSVHSFSTLDTPCLLA